VAENFDVSRPAISRHMKILTECGLIVVHQKGRERFCEANLRPLAEVSEWVEKYHAFWTGKMDALEKFLSKTGKHPRKRSQKEGQTKIKRKRWKP
jgi:DNA-binding transcriptional ArsR family regulator